MLALTALTPVIKGRLLDTEGRWGIISKSVDCRTPAERGRVDLDATHEDLNASGQRHIYKSLYDSISTYIHQGRMTRMGILQKRTCQSGTELLLQRVILTFDMNLYVPMSKVDANMQRAHSRIFLPTTHGSSR
jgi:hypothetical protein